MENGLFFKGILYIALVPMIVVALTILEIYMRMVDLLTFFVLTAYPLLIYFFIFIRNNAYTDSEVLEKVKIPNAPPKIEELLKTGTRGTNRLINVDLILILGAKKSLIQSELVKLLRKRRYDLSDPAIIKYIRKLKESEVFAYSKGLYKTEYSLTQKGEWCYKAVKKCFPKTFLFFVIRHYIRIKSLPEFPQNNQPSQPK